MLHGSAPRTPDFDRVMASREAPVSRGAPAGLTNGAVTPLDYSAMRDPLRFAQGGAYGGEMPEARELVPRVQAAEVAAYVSAVEGRVRAFGPGYTRTSEKHVSESHPFAARGEPVGAAVAATRGADAEFETAYATGARASTARDLLIRVPTTPQYVAVPDRNGHVGTMPCVRATAVYGGKYGTVTQRGAASALRFAGSEAARPVPTRVVSCPLAGAPHDGAHRVVSGAGALAGELEPTRRQASHALGDGTHYRAVTAGAVPVGVTATRVLVPRGTLGAERTLVGDERCAPSVGTTRAAPRRLGELGGRVLAQPEAYGLGAPATSHARPEAYRLGALGGRVLATDAEAPAASMRGKCGGAHFGALAEHGGAYTHGTLAPSAEHRRVAVNEIPLREGGVARGQARVQPTVRLRVDGCGGDLAVGARNATQAPMERVVVAEARKLEGAVWAR